jgi:UDPglucose 6-dehydrogenase
MREAPSLYIVQHLLEAGAIIKAYDPIAIKAKHHFAIPSHTAKISTNTY